MKPQDLLYGAVGGLTQAIGDPYTVFMTPPQNTEFRDALRTGVEPDHAALAAEGHGHRQTHVAQADDPDAGRFVPYFFIELHGESIEHGAALVHPRYL